MQRIVSWLASWCSCIRQKAIQQAKDDAEKIIQRNLDKFTKSTGFLQKQVAKYDEEARQLLKTGEKKAAIEKWRNAEPLRARLQTIDMVRSDLQTKLHALGDMDVLQMVQKANDKTAAALDKLRSIVRVEDIEKAGDRASDAMDSFKEMKTALKQTTPAARPALSDSDVEAQILQLASTSNTSSKPFSLSSSTPTPAMWSLSVEDDNTTRLDVEPLLLGSSSKFDTYASEHLFVRQAEQAHARTIVE